MPPSDIVLELIVCFLTPLFMDGCSGNLGFARLAAMETLASYRAQTQAELVKIVQIIAFGLAAMDNLGLSMAPDLSLSMKLRLRAGANALNRSAQQNTRALEKNRRESPPLEPCCAERSAMAEAQAVPPVDEDAVTEATLQVAIEQAQTMIEAARVRRPAAQPAATIQPPTAVARSGAVTLPVAAATHPAAVEHTTAATPPSAAAPKAPVATDQQNKLMWASAMNSVAAELSGSLHSIPPASRRATLMQATSLSSAASDLIGRAGCTPLAAMDATLRAAAPALRR